jgi:hypothetical protein
MNPRIRGLVIFALCAAAGIAPSQAALAEPVVVIQSWSDNDSRISERGCSQLTSEAAWHDIWRQHAGNEKPAPAVDFTAHMVLVLFDGKRTDSYGIQAAQPNDQVHNGATLYVLDQSFQSMQSGLGGPSYVYPFGIFVVARQPKYKVMLGHQSDHKGSPYTWSEVPCPVK